MGHHISAAALLSLGIVASASSFAGDLQPYRAREIQPYKAQEVKPYQAQEVKPYQARQVQPYRAGEVEQRRAPSINAYQAQPIQRYQAQEVRLFTKEERARMDEQTRREARRIAAQRQGNGAPGTANAAAQQAYWQQQVLHRTTEASNPYVTYNGR